MKLNWWSFCHGIGWSDVPYFPNKGAILPKLPSYFYQLTRSFVINLNEIYRFDSSRLFIHSNEIAIPEGKRKELRNILLVVTNKKAYV